MSALNAIRQQPSLLQLPPSQFNEGARTTAQKVGAIATTALTALVSFVFLPWEAALFITAAVAALFSMCCCCCDSERVAEAALALRLPAQASSVQHVYHSGPAPVVHHTYVPAVQQPAYAYSGFVPVVNPGRREVVGDAHLNAPPVQFRQEVPSPAERGNHIPVGRGQRHLVNAEAVLPPALAPVPVQANLRMQAYPAPVNMPQQQQQQQGVNRVPVGHARR